MIEFLQGELAGKDPSAVTVRVAGVGFIAQVPLSTFDVLPREGAEVRLLTHLYMREDGPSLYAFATDVERRLFRMLLGVSRVGPGMAIQVLGSCSPADFKRYILDEDAEGLKSMVKGIGAKTARRLIAELQGPIEQLPVAPARSVASRAARDAVQALAALGESHVAAQKAVQAAVQQLGTEASAEELVELALKS